MQCTPRGVSRSFWRRSDRPDMTVGHDLARFVTSLQRCSQTRRHRDTTGHACVSSGYHQIPLDLDWCLADFRQYPNLHGTGPARNGHGSPLAACHGGRPSAFLSATYVGLEVALPVGCPNQREVAKSLCMHIFPCTLLHARGALQYATPKACACCRRAAGLFRRCHRASIPVVTASARGLKHSPADGLRSSSLQAEPAASLLPTAAAALHHAQVTVAAKRNNDIATPSSLQSAGTR